MNKPVKGRLWLLGDTPIAEASQSSLYGAEER